MSGLVFQTVVLRYLVKIDGITNAVKYHQISIHHAIPTGKHLISYGFSFHDDSKHTVNTAKACMDLKKKEEEKEA